MLWKGFQKPKRLEVERETATEHTRTGSPSASAVLVVMPSFSVARYALSASRLACENLVAAPKHSGSKPVASGSSVPVWPPFSARSRPLAF